MMMMGTMIPSFLKAAKPFRKYETTAARENHFDGFSFFYDQSSWDWETKEKNYYFSTYTTTPANLPKESR